MPKLSMIIILLGALVVTGCDEQNGDVDAGEIDQALFENYNEDVFDYFAVRRDYRKCMYPMCGGFWLKSVNGLETLCADGEYAEECYVADAAFGEYDLKGFGYHLIAKGRIVENQVGDLGNFGAFEIDEVWESATDTVSDDIVFFTQDAGIRCIKAPCPGWKNGDILNWGYGIRFDVVELGNVEGATEAQIEEAQNAIYGDGVLVAGYPSFVKAGSWFDFDLALVATQVYLRVVPRSDDPLFCEKPEDCTWSRYGSLVESVDECYCPMCHKHLINVETNELRHKNWTTYCGDEAAWNGALCPQIRCVMPPMYDCVENTCVREKQESAE